MMETPSYFDVELKLEEHLKVQDGETVSIDEHFFSSFESTKTAANFEKVYNRLAKLYAEKRIFCDQMLRRTEKRMLPQTKIFLLDSISELSKSGMFAPRHPFNLPSVYYHCCRPGQELSRRFTTEQEFSFHSKFIGMNLHVTLNNRNAQFYSKNCDGTLEKLKSVSKDFKNPWQSRKIGEDLLEGDMNSVTLLGHQFAQCGEEIFDFTIIRKVEIILNGEQLVDSQDIHRVKFFKEKEDQDYCEVLVLFKSFFMAGGRIFKEVGAGFICILSEITGTYGTTSFICSPNFRSMIRVSQMMTEAPKRERSPEEIDVELGKIRGMIVETAKYLTHLLNKKKCRKKTIHTKNRRELVKELCSGFTSLIRLIPIFTSSISRLPESSAHWSIREKLAFIGSKKNPLLAEKQDGWFECGEGNCKAFKRLIGIAIRLVKTPEDFPFDGEFLLEYSFQVLMALYSMSSCLTRETTDEDLPSEILLHKITSHFWNLYASRLSDLIMIFDLVPKIMKEVVLDVICSRATSSSLVEILDFYPSEPEMMLEALKRYPHLLLFSSHPVDLRRDLLDSFSDWVEYQMLPPVQGPVYYIQPQFSSPESQIDVREGVEAEVSAEIEPRTSSVPSANGEEIEENRPSTSETRDEPETVDQEENAIPLQPEEEEEMDWREPEDRPPSSTHSEEPQVHSDNEEGMDRRESEETPDAVNAEDEEEEEVRPHLEGNGNGASSSRRTPNRRREESHFSVSPTPGFYTKLITPTDVETPKSRTATTSAKNKTFRTPRGRRNKEAENGDTPSSRTRSAAQESMTNSELLSNSMEAYYSFSGDAVKDY